MKHKNGKVIVNRMYKAGGKLVEQDDQVEEIELPMMDDSAPITTVSTDISMTRNLGDFNSAKVGVFCSVPAYMNDTEMQYAFDFAKNFVDTQCEQRMEEFVEYLKKRGLI